MAKLLIKAAFIASLLLSLIVSSWFVIHKDINFTSDIARDFLLFKEIDTKKIILIGPKSSVAGLFHGPLWLYLNYPAYLLGHGNPIVVGVFWILLSALFIASCFYVGKKLFGKETGMLFASMTALYMFFHINEFFNPLGAMFLIPINFYLFVKYTEKYELKYLIPYVIILGLIVQFELAIGIPLVILSVLYVFVRLIKTPKRFHFLTFALIAVPLANFALFDLRHSFLLTQGVIRYLSPQSGDSVRFSYVNLLIDRVKLLSINVEILRFDPYLRNAVTGLIFIFLLITQLKDNKYKRVYLLFIYFYVGYFATTFINKGPILYFYFFPFFPLVFLIFSSFITSRYRNIFFVLFLVIYFMNLQTAFIDISESRKTIGISQTSWKFLNNMASQVYSGKEKEFGYFVYTPDTIAYSPKYALQYEQHLFTDKKSYYFTKKSITYIVVAPPAPDNPYLSYSWWKKVRLRIDNKPISIYTFPNGYKIEKYKLSDEEVKIPFDEGIDPGLNFR